MTRMNKHAWIVGLGLLLPACGDDGIEGASGDGTATEGTDTATTDASATLTTTTTTTPGDTSTSESDTTQGDSADETAGEETAGEETAGEETAGEETAGEETAGEETAGEETAGEETGTGSTGEASTGTTGGDPECTVNDDCAALDDACNIGICEQGECVADALENDTACETDPGNHCITGEVCTDGVCGGGSMVDCSDFDDQCLAGVCDPDDGTCSAEPANEGMDCDDGEVCTYDDICVAGVCEGSSEPIFVETFGDNTQGWTTEGKWEIAETIDGAAGSITQLTDPEFDHTGDAANGVAGVVISDTQGEGGLSGPPEHAAQYLTSPQIDLSVLDDAASKELRFWRWLVNQDLWMIDTVDVYDGTDWVNIWTPPGTVLDQEWQEMTFDISDYDNADFQIRFGHQYDAFQLGGPSEPSWSVDDVSIGPVCGGG